MHDGRRLSHRLLGLCLFPDVAQGMQGTQEALLGGGVLRLVVSVDRLGEPGVDVIAALQDVGEEDRNDSALRLLTLMHACILSGGRGQGLTAFRLTLCSQLLHPPRGQ